MNDDHQNASESRRRFLAGTVAAASASLTACAMSRANGGGNSEITATSYWAHKDTPQGRVRLFLWRKQITGHTDKGTIVFVHGSSMASTPVFDLTVPGRSDASVMERFARMGFDTWCFDCEGYGRSDKHRDINCDIATGADDCAAAVRSIVRITGRRKVLLYGASSGALRAALYAQRDPSHVKRLALDAFVWTGAGSPTLAERRKRLPQFRAANRRPINREFVRSIFTRDHPGTSDLTVVEAFADAVLALDTSVPTGTYVDMSANLPVVDPTKLNVPVLIMRGQWDGIASVEDLNSFFMKLPNPDKQFIVMPGIAHTSMRSKNYALVYHLLTAFLSQPDPVYVG
jgi:pimeloyl-ACP methyl ester carboxylesterase